MRPVKLALFLWYLENVETNSYRVAELFGVSVYEVTCLRKAMLRTVLVLPPEARELKAKSPLHIVKSDTSVEVDVELIGSPLPRIPPRG